MNFKLLPFKPTNPSANPTEKGDKERHFDLGDGSEVVYISRFLPVDESWNWFHYLDKQIPWNRPTIRVFGRSTVQPRDICYVASEGLPELKYSGHQPPVRSWDEFPPLKDILAEVEKALPGRNFNSVLLNRYTTGADYVAWHADDEKLYGPTPEIASISLGCEREFFLKRKPDKILRAQGALQNSGKAPKGKEKIQHNFRPKHGSLLIMRGNTQRDYYHTVPKRAKADTVRINLTFRHVIPTQTHSEALSARFVDGESCLQ